MGVLSGLIFVILSILAYVKDVVPGAFTFILGLIACFSVILLVANNTENSTIFGKVMGFLSKYTMPIFLIELCQGEYVFFMDADDTILHNTLSDLYDVISRTEADIVSFQYQKIQNLKDVVEQALPHEYEVLSREQAMRLFLQERLIGISMCTKLVKRSAIENIKFEVGRASNEDKDFLFNTLLSATRIVALQTKYYCYWTRENSATTRPFDKRWFDGYYFAKKIYVCICEKMPKLEADARYQLLSSCYFLVRQMDNQKVRKDYPSEYRMIKNEIHDLRIDDILNIISPQRRKGIMLIKYAPWLYSLLKG